METPVIEALLEVCWDRYLKDKLEIIGLKLLSCINLMYLYVKCWKIPDVSAKVALKDVVKTINFWTQRNSKGKCKGGREFQR